MKQRAPDCVFAPAVRLCGELQADICEGARDGFREAIAKGDPFAFELTTGGGDVDLAQGIAEDIAIALDRGADVQFVGKTKVYSAGVNIMSAFPRARRWLTRDCFLMMHERRLSRSIDLEGPLRGSRQRLEELVAEIDLGLALEVRDFGRLVDGSEISPEECRRRARTAWYLGAAEALECGLVAGLV